MNHTQLMTALKARYQIDPCSGSRWVETSDLEEIASIACLNGRAYLPDTGMVTWAEGAGYQFAPDAAPPAGDGA